MTDVPLPGSAGVRASRQAAAGRRAGAVLAGGQLQGGPASTPPAPVRDLTCPSAACDRV